MVIWQSKVQIFGQHIILKPQTSFDQWLIMILKAWLKNHQNAKVSLFGQLKKSTVNWPGHNFHMDCQKNPIQSSFWRERHFLQLIFILQVQEMLSQKVINFNIIGHFQKSTKTPFLSKLHTWAWNIKLRRDQKGWLEDISRFIKIPRTPPKSQNWGSYALLKLTIFAKLSKVNYPQNFKFFQMGPIFFTCFKLET